MISQLILILIVYVMSLTVAFSQSNNINFFTELSNPVTLSYDSDISYYDASNEPDLSTYYQEVILFNENFLKNWKGVFISRLDLEIGEDYIFRVYQDMSRTESGLLSIPLDNFGDTTDDNEEIQLPKYTPNKYYNIIPGYRGKDYKVNMNKYWCEIPFTYKGGNVRITDKDFDKYNKTDIKKIKEKGRLLGHSKYAFGDYNSMYTHLYSIIEIVHKDKIIFRGGVELRLADW